MSPSISDTVTRGNEIDILIASGYVYYYLQRLEKASQGHEETLRTAVETGDHQAKAFIKTDSKADRKIRTTIDTSRHCGNSRATPIRPKSPSAKNWQPPKLL